MAILGGLIGGKIALKVKPKYLKTLFVITAVVVSFLMLANAFFLNRLKLE